MTAVTGGVIGLLAASAGATTTIGVAHKFKYVKSTKSVNGGGTAFMDAADCGSGLVAVSGGSLMTGFPAELRMTWDFTAGSHQLWTSRGFNTGFGKTLTTIALCRHSSPNVRYMEHGRTLFAAPSVETAQVGCPAGMVVASGGVRINAPSSEVHVSSSFPIGAKRVWRATVVNDSGGEQFFSEFAVCVPAGANLTYPSSSVQEAVTANGFDVDMPCPGSRVPISGGVSWSGNQTQVHISSSGPIDSGGSASTIPDAAWRIGTNNDAGATKTLTTYAVCAPA